MKTKCDVLARDCYFLAALTTRFTWLLKHCKEARHIFFNLNQKAFTSPIWSAPSEWSCKFPLHHRSMPLPGGQSIFLKDAEIPVQRSKICSKMLQNSKHVRRVSRELHQSPVGDPLTQVLRSWLILGNFVWSDHVQRRGFFTPRMSSYSIRDSSLFQSTSQHCDVMQQSSSLASRFKFNIRGLLQSGAHLLLMGFLKHGIQYWPYCTLHTEKFHANLRWATCSSALRWHDVSCLFPFACSCRELCESSISIDSRLFKSLKKVL